MNAPEVIDGTVAEDDTGQELVPTTPPPVSLTLFHTDDPVEVIEHASRIATALERVVSAQGLVEMIQGKKHPKVEAWQTLGAMLGVTAIVISTRRIEPITRYTVEVKHFEGSGKQRRHARTSSWEVEGYDWEAVVEARTLDGRMIGRAEAMCSRSEQRWAKADNYAVRSMASTRATSRALKGPLGFVMSLAGYSSTPAEEMTSERPTAPAGPAPRGQAHQPRPERATAKAAEPTEPLATPAQRRKIFATAKSAGCEAEPQQRAIFEWIADTPHSDRITKARVDDVIQAFEGYEQTLTDIHGHANDPNVEGHDRAKAIVDRYLKES